MCSLVFCLVYAQGVGGLITFNDMQIYIDHNNGVDNHVNLVLATNKMRCLKYVASFISALEFINLNAPLRTTKIKKLNRISIFNYVYLNKTLAKFIVIR